MSEPAAAPAGPDGLRTVVVHPHLKAERIAADDLVHRVDEATGLARALDLEVVLSEAVALPAWRPATLLGAGTVERLKGFVDAEKVALVFVDRALSPIQQRNLEKAWNCKVVDRTGLILEIFGTRARTSEGRLQVELARLTYQRGRLVRTWTHLERQRGGRGFLAGPGETQLEADRRIIADKIERLKAQIEDVKRTRGLHRRARSRVPYPVVSLVGYTNAGKSTLLNKLTHSHEFVADMLFATLDTRTRQWRLSDGRTVLLSDTVGFLERLPHNLVASFHATLEEALHADLLLHVVDGSHPSASLQMLAVEEVLGSLGKDLSDAILVFNKSDAVQDPLTLQYLRQGRTQEAVHISARTGAGLAELDAAVRRRLDRRSALVDLYFPIQEGRIEAAVRRLCSPLEEDWDAERSLRRLRVRLTEGALGHLRRSSGPGLRVETVAPASEPRLA